MLDLGQLLREKLGLGQSYVSQKPENLGVQYRKFGPVSVMSGYATPESKKQALMSRKAGSYKQYEDGSDNRGRRAMDSLDDFQSSVRAQQQIQQAPFRMYEDNSFQGDPRQAALARPSTTFYEDNSFSSPQPLQRANVSGGLRVQPAQPRQPIQLAPGGGGLQGSLSGSLMNQLSVKKRR
jgi:hypothetical protein